MDAVLIRPPCMVDEKENSWAYTFTDSTDHTIYYIGMEREELVFDDAVCNLYTGEMDSICSIAKCYGSDGICTHPHGHQPSALNQMSYLQYLKCNQRY